MPASMGGKETPVRPNLSGDIPTSMPVEPWLIQGIALPNSDRHHCKHVTFTAAIITNILASTSQLTGILTRISYYFVMPLRSAPRQPGTRERILMAARQQFGEHGYRA